MPMRPCTSLDQSGGIYNTVALLCALELELFTAIISLATCCNDYIMLTDLGCLLQYWCYCL